MVAQQHPELIFYGYTKALPFWAKRLHAVPANMKLVASRGGTHDHFIDMFGLRSARVVLSEREAGASGSLKLTMMIRTSGSVTATLLFCFTVRNRKGVKRARHGTSFTSLAGRGTSQVL